jgi:hypothetical protein
MLESLRTVRETARVLASSQHQHDPQLQESEKAKHHHAKKSAEHRLKAVTTALVFAAGLTADGMVCKAMCKSSV